MIILFRLQVSYILTQIMCLYFIIDMYILMTHVVGLQREFVLALEEAFEIEIEDEKVQSISTVGQAAEVIEELLK